MKDAENIERLIKSEKIKTNPSVNEAVFNDLVDRLDAAGHTETGTRQPNIWRIFMQSKTTKLAAAAVILITTILCFQIIPIPDAYALEDTIEAYNSIRWLHVFDYNGLENTKPRTEVWLCCDEFGNIEQMRFESKHNVGNPIGELVVAGTSESSEAWLPDKNVHIIGYGDPSVLMFGFDISQLDPKHVFEKIYEQEKSGQAFVDVHTPKQKSEPIVVTLTYPSDSKSNKWKKIVYVDQATKLVNKVEKYELRSNGFEIISVLEFVDYNQPIDVMMFTLEGDVSDDATVTDMSEIEIGLNQYDMTKKQTVEQLTRDFFQAVIDKDYFRAGQFCLGAPDFLVRNILESSLMGANFVEILSVGPGHRDPDPDSDAMNCSCKMLAEYKGGYYVVNAYMVSTVPVGQNADRWIIYGLDISIEPADGKINLYPDQNDPSVATYYGLEPGEFIKRWLVLGPLPYPSKDGIDFDSEEGQKVAFDMDFIDPASFSETVDIRGEDFKWALMESEYNHIDLRQLNENDNDFEIAYVMALVDMSEEKTVTLGIGSDDGVKVWLNGKLVHQNWLIRGVVTDNDLVPVTFKKGTNQLVLKIQNSMGPWGFCCRATE